jgi:hypothetical protein
MKTFLKFGTAVVIGVLIGGGSAYMILASYMNKVAEQVEAANIITTISDLRALRSGNTQSGYDLLETRLNGSIIMFYSSAPQTKEGSNALSSARNYRKLYPFKGSDTNLEDAVYEVLSRKAN